MTQKTCPRPVGDTGYAGGHSERPHHSGHNPVAARPQDAQDARNGAGLTIDTPRNELEAAKALCNELEEILRLLRCTHRHFEQAEFAQRKSRFFTNVVSCRGRSPVNLVHRPHTNRVRLSRCRSTNQRSIPPSNKGRSKGNRSLPPKALFRLKLRTLLPGNGCVVNRRITPTSSVQRPNKKSKLSRRATPVEGAVSSANAGRGGRRGVWSGDDVTPFE